MTHSNEIQFRLWQESDFTQLAELRIQQLKDEGYPEKIDIRESLIAYFKESFENSSLTCWLAISNDQIIATSGICFYKQPPTFSNPSGKMAYITNMYTLNEFRKRGIATKLIKYLLIEAEQSEHNVIKLHASNDGKSIYEKIGFEHVDGYMFKRL